MSAQKRRTFKIEAFKHRVDIDPKYAERTWKVLEHAIHEIYNHNASGLSFEELYSCHWILTVIEPYTEIVYVLDSLSHRMRYEDWKYIVEMALRLFNSNKGKERSEKISVGNTTGSSTTRWETMWLLCDEIYETDYCRN